MKYLFYGYKALVGVFVGFLFFGMLGWLLIFCVLGLVFIPLFAEDYEDAKDDFPGLILGSLGFFIWYWGFPGGGFGRLLDLIK